MCSIRKRMAKREKLIGVETYLRCFCNEQPKQWYSWIPLAEYWYNTTFHILINATPYSVLYGRPPPPLVSYGDRKTTNDTLEHPLIDRDKALVALKEHLALAQNRMKKFADQRRRFYGPYMVLGRVGAMAYKLDLPREATIHNVFHVSQFKKCVGTRDRVLSTS